jgi:hypothetical protein
MIKSSEIEPKKACQRGTLFSLVYGSLRSNGCTGENVSS